MQQAIDQVFRLFRQTRSIRQTCIWFQRRGLELPVNKRQGNTTRLVWQIPSKQFIGSILHNPCYAGAYVWGQRPTQRVVVEGKVTKRTGPCLDAARGAAFPRAAVAAASGGMSKQGGRKRHGEVAGGGDVRPRSRLRGRHHG